MLIRKIYHKDTIAHVVQKLKLLSEHNSVFTFTGSLGAGKSTLVRGLLQSFGVTDPITSPTFTYVNIYKNDQGQTFYHFDCYRIEKIEDFIMAGFDEYLYQPNSWVFIEWPEPVLPLLKHSVCHVALEHQKEEDKRLIIIK